MQLWLERHLHPVKDRLIISEFNKKKAILISTPIYLFSPECYCIEEPHHVSNHLKCPYLHFQVAEMETGFRCSTQSLSLR